jgi:hypothetical protein
MANKPIGPSKVLGTRPIEPFQLISLPTILVGRYEVNSRLSKVEQFMNNVKQFFKFSMRRRFCSTVSIRSISPSAARCGLLDWVERTNANSGSSD